MSETENLYDNHDPDELPSELRPLSNVDWDELDSRRIEQLVERLPDDLLDDVPADDRLVRGILATGIGIRVDDEVKPTVAGVVAFGIRPHLRLPGLRVVVSEQRDGPCRWRGGVSRGRVSRPPRQERPPSGARARPGPTQCEVGPLAPWMMARLRRLCRRKTIDAAVPLRARIISMLARDPCVRAVAERLDIDRNTVRQWRDRFLRHGLKGLYDRPRCEVASMACNRPAAYGIKHRRTWTHSTLHEAFVAAHPAEKISRTSVIRIHLHPPAGTTVLCVDEKTGMQALKRKHPTKWAGLGRPGRWEYEYKRLGTRTLFAAFNTQSGHVFAEVSKKRKAVDLLRFMRKLAKQYPKGEVHIIWDNLNIHYDGPSKRWTKFNQRHGGRFHFHDTPLHASWVNQVELFFARVQRRVLRFASFDSVDQMSTEVMDFIDYWNKHERKPYRWKFRGYPLEEAKQAA